MNNELAKYIGGSLATIAVSLTMIYLSNRYSNQRTRQKIKDDNWAAVLKDLKRSLDHTSPERNGSALVARDRLSSYLRAYIIEHPSQTEHFKKYIDRLEALTSPDHNYKTRMKQIRIIIAEIQQPITQYSHD